jgi:multicomponent Na+:H+ antiporter subunit B
VRRVLGVAGLAALTGLAVWAVTGLPSFGHPRGPYAIDSVRAMLQERHVSNTVVGITFDLRGIDTLGEELILFSAALGSTLLLRAQRREGRVEEAAQHAEEKRPLISPSVRALGAYLVGPTLMLAVYVIAHGNLTPGGGFQGGVIAAAALLLVYAAGQMVAIEHVRPVAVVELAEAVGAAAYVLVAIGGIVFGTVAMANFLGFGTEGSLLSGGTIPVLNAAVGVEVTGAVTLIITEFLDQALLRHAGARQT